MKLFVIGAVAITLPVAFFYYPASVFAEIQTPSFMSDIKTPSDISRLSEEQLTRLEEYVVRKADEKRTTGNGAGNDVTNCMELVPTGSVSIELRPMRTMFESGGVARFEGVVRNSNPFAIKDVSLVVRVFRENAAAYGDAAKTISVPLDELIIDAGSSIPPSGVLPISVEWKIPGAAVSGRYALSAVALSGGRPLTVDDRPDIPAMLPGFAFQVTGNGVGSAFFDRNTVEVKGTDKGDGANDSLGFDRNETVGIGAYLKNPSSEAVDVVVTWEVSDSSIGAASDVTYQKKEIVRVSPNESKWLSFHAEPEWSRGTMTRLRVVAESNGAKSILVVGFVRNGFNRIHLGQVGILGGDSGTADAFTCVGTDRSPIVNDSKVIITLSDDAGNGIASHEYAGSVYGSSTAIRHRFTLPVPSLTAIHMNVSLEKEGNVVDTREISYECDDFSPSLCSNGPEAVADSENDGKGVFRGRFILPIAIVAGVFLTLCSSLIWYFFRKRRVAAVVLGMFLFGQFALVGNAHAIEQVTWSSGAVPGSPLYSSGSSWYLGVRNIAASITYAASLKNASTGADIPDGSSVPVGTVLRFEPKAFENDDIQWSGDKFRLGFPLLIHLNTVLHGYWTPAAASPAGSCDESNAAGIITLSIWPPLVFLYYVPLSVNPPSVTLESTGTAGLSCTGMTCTVTSPGTVSTKVVFASTNGKFYYRWAEWITGFLGGLCNGSSNAMREAGISTDYTLSVPQQEIPFDLNATPVSTLRLCVDGAERSTIDILYTGSSVSLKTYFDTGSGCSGTDVTAQTTFLGTNAPGDAVTVAGANPAGSVPGAGTRTVTGNYPVAGASAAGQQSNSEQVTVTYPGQPQKTLDVTVYEVCTLDCSDSGTVCKNEPYTKKDACGDNRVDGCTGTRDCDTNWKETRPGF